MSSYYVGVDVGSSSVRAALVDDKGNVKATSTQSILVWSPMESHYQQSSNNIWQACCTTVKQIITEVDINQIRGIGFDATCSLVVLDKSFLPLTISPLREPEQNVIMWLDHRASEQAEIINNKKHPILHQYGGSISLEQNPSKILWLKQKFESHWWDQLGHLFDLPDFLTWKATGSLSRSLCSLVCKLAYRSDVDSHGWDPSFWKGIGLEDLMDNQAAILGSVVQEVGQPVGHGLSVESAQELGLNPGTAVGTSMIDAHCGTIGLLACKSEMVRANPLTSCLSLISGTSTCHMIVSENAIFVPGVWGPFYSAVLPRLWLNEGGQSATGKLIDHIIDSHPASKGLAAQTSKNTHVTEELNKILVELQKQNGVNSVAYLTRDLHIWPDFHGNRSPVADPSLKGMVCGLTLATSVKDLALKYLAAVQSLAYGTKHIIEAMTEVGHKISCIVLCGGLGKNPLYLQMHADVTGLPVIFPTDTELVLLGGAILGATASGDFYSIQKAMLAMGWDGQVVSPNENDKWYHAKKYAIFKKMLQHQKEYQIIMESG